MRAAQSSSPLTPQPRADQSDQQQWLECRDGVKGKSGGLKASSGMHQGANNPIRCNTCRQRRVKCTEEKPACSRCLRGGFACHGYARKTVWHHLTTEPSPGEGSTQPALGRLMAIEGQEPDNSAKAGTMVHAKMPPMPTQVSLAAFQEDLCFAYIFSNFVWRGYGASWLHQSAQGLLGQLAFDSVKALAEMSFGKSQKSHQTEIQGRLKYGKALRHMVEKLGDGRRGELRELVVPILLLLMHTVMKAHFA